MIIYLMNISQWISLTSCWIGQETAGFASMCACVYSPYWVRFYLVWARRMVGISHNRLFLTEPLSKVPQIQMTENSKMAADERAGRERKQPVDVNTKRTSQDERLKRNYDNYISMEMFHLLWKLWIGRQIIPKRRKTGYHGKFNHVQFRESGFLWHTWWSEGKKFQESVVAKVFLC